MCQEESAWGWLVQLSSNPDTMLHPLTREQHRVGRDSLHCSVVLGAREAEEAEKSFGGGDPNIFSRQHFAVSKTLGEEVAVLEDLGSRNGTWVNGVNVGVGRKMVLQHCSKISLLGPDYHLFQYLDRISMETLYSPRIISEYLVSDLLGEGTTAEVRRAYKYHSGSTTASSVALKMIKTKNWGSQYTKPKYIEAEVVIQRSLRHPCIVKIQDVIKTEDKITVVMEHVKGGDLFDVLFVKKPVRRRTEYEVKILFYQLAHCIRHLHRNKIAHRDLKLENILVSSSSPFSRIKVSDFGLSKVWSGKSPLRTYAGTPAYMAPEIARLEDRKKDEECQYSAKADCWSLGVILFTMLSMSYPFGDGSDLRRILSGRFSSMNSRNWVGVSSEAKDLVRSLLEVDVDRRLSSEMILQHSWLVMDEGAVNTARKLMVERE